MTATVDPPSPPGWPARTRPGTPLTDRERHVLDLVSHGYSNNEVAKRLYVTHNTVKSLLRSTFIRLGARDRAHAVRLGFELGYLTADEVPS